MKANIDRRPNYWHGISVQLLWAEFQSGNIGPALNELLDLDLFRCDGRSPFHLRRLEKTFYEDMAERHIEHVVQIIGRGLRLPCSE